MKSLVSIFMISIFLITSCCGGDSKKEGSNSDSEKVIHTETKVEAVTSEEVNSSEEAKVTNEKGAVENIESNKCNKFLDEYEIWANDYIDLLETFKTNPTDPKLTQDYNNLSLELATWTNDWFEFVECTEDVDYQKRYDEINEKVEMKQNELKSV